MSNVFQFKPKEPEFKDGDGDDPPDEDTVEVVCCVCTIHFWVTKEFDDLRLEDHDWWFCPVGHEQRYTPPKSEQQPPVKVPWWRKLL